MEGNLPSGSSPSKGSASVGRVVGVYGRNMVRISIKEEALPLVAKPGVYVKVRSVSGTTLYGVVVSFNLVDELYKASRVLELVEGYEEFRPARNELVVNLVGYEKDGAILRGIPELPKPGERVYVVSAEELKEIFKGGSVSIGNLSQDPEIEVKLDLNMLCSRHLAILAMTGAGKSNCLAVILSEIASKYPGARIVLFDTHNEYITLAKSKTYPVYVYSPLEKMSRLIEQQFNVKVFELEVPLWTMTIDELYSLLKLDAKATKQKMYLRQVVRDVKRSVWSEAGVNDPIHYRVEHLVKNITNLRAQRRDSSLDDLLVKVEELSENEELKFVTDPKFLEDVFQRRVSEKLGEGKSQRVAEHEASLEVYSMLARELLKSGVNVIALGGLSSETQDAVVATLLRALWRFVVELRFQGRVASVLIAVEEAHVYAHRSRWSSSKYVLERIAREGRKFGVGLIVVSQRPRELSDALLAQCGNLIALRTVNPEDQKHILESMEEVSYEIIQGLPGLRIGEALISGPAITFPAIVQVHSYPERFGAELGGKDVNFEEQWSTKEFEKASSPVSS